MEGVVMEQGSVTVQEVLEFFTEVTGLTWYPPPDIVFKSQILSCFVQMIDDIIAEQARTIGANHISAERNTNAVLCGKTHARFLEAKKWVDGLAKPERCALRQYAANQIRQQCVSA